MPDEKKEDKPQVPEIGDDQKFDILVNAIRTANTSSNDSMFRMVVMAALRSIENCLSKEGRPLKNFKEYYDKSKIPLKEDKK